jgi:hypothetical protein
MKTPISINIAAEDALSEAVIRKIVSTSGRRFLIGASFVRGGYGYLKNKIGGFNNAAKAAPFFVLTDLDQAECAPILMRSWLTVPQHPNLLFRVAVKEVESWLMADRSSFSAYLKIDVRKVPHNPDSVDDPKRLLLDLTRTSPRKDIRNDIVPPQGSQRKLGPNYNARLIAFVFEHWEPERAQSNSESLERTIRQIKHFRKI